MHIAVLQWHFLSQLVDNVQIYEERKENGQWLKSIEFRNGQEQGK